MASRRPGDAQAPFAIDFRAAGLGIKGLASGAYTQQINHSRNVSINLRERLGRLIESEIAIGGRGAASTGRLVKASIDSRNTFVDPYFVAIGLPKFLDQSQAKYWRTFEEGSARVWKRPFIGTVLFAVGHRAPFPVAHGASPGLRTSRTADFERAASDGSRTRPLPRDGRAIPNLGGQSAAPLFVVRHEIAPANIYHRVFVENQPAMRQWGQYASTAYLTKRLGEVVAGKDFKPPEVR